jgi:hypothetical protein
MTSAIDPGKTDIQAWIGLLQLLSDDELQRYGAIALDQYDKELRYWWAQALFAIGAVVSGALLARGLVVSGVGRLAFLTLGFSWVLGYWPYRSAKTRALWWSHYAAVLAEQARRVRASQAANSDQHQALRPDEPVRAGRAAV